MVYHSSILGGKFAVAFIRWKSEFMFVVQMGEVMADRGLSPPVCKVTSSRLSFFSFSVSHQRLNDHGRPCRATAFVIAIHKRWNFCE